MSAPTAPQAPRDQQDPPAPQAAHQARQAQPALLERLAPQVQLAQAHPGVPIKMTWTREEDMTHDFPRPLGMARMRGATAGGRVSAYDLSLCYPSVTASQLGRLGQPARPAAAALLVALLVAPPADCGCVAACD